MENISNENRSVEKHDAVYTVNQSWRRQQIFKFISTIEKLDLIDPTTIDSLISRYFLYYTINKSKCLSVYDFPAENNYPTFKCMLTSTDE